MTPSTYRQTFSPTTLFAVWLLFLQNLPCQNVCQLEISWKQHQRFLFGGSLSFTIFPLSGIFRFIIWCSFSAVMSFVYVWVACLLYSEHHHTDIHCPLLCLFGLSVDRHQKMFHWWTKSENSVCHLCISHSRLVTEFGALLHFAYSPGPSVLTNANCQLVFLFSFITFSLFAIALSETFSFSFVRSFLLAWQRKEEATDSS